MRYMPWNGITLTAWEWEHARMKSWMEVGLYGSVIHVMQQIFLLATCFHILA